jgi:predicted MPP superfamily phosphohydrolase
MLKMVLLSDIHCGSIWGLTPTKWQFKDNDYTEIQNDFYNWFQEKIKEIGPIDIAVINGDAIDGNSKTGIDHLTNDLNKQCEIAIDVIESLKAKKHYFIYGTPFHVTDGLNAEDIIADNFNEVPHTHLKLKIKNHVFDFKHTTSKTSIPHGQGTLLAKRMLWSSLKDLLSGDRKADYYIRSHIHEYSMIDNDMGCAITTPALQLPFSAYGRKYDGWYTVGFMVFTVDDYVNIEKYIYKFKKRDIMQVFEG